MKNSGSILAFVLGAATAIAAIFGAGLVPLSAVGLATTREVETLRLKVADLDRALRESQSKFQAEVERQKREANARSAEEAARKSQAEEASKARAAAALKAGTAARQKAEAEAAAQAKLVQQREADIQAKREAARKAMEDAARRAAAARVDPRSRSEREAQRDADAAAWAIGRPPGHVAPLSPSAPVPGVPAAKADRSEAEAMYQQALVMESSGKVADAVRIYRRAGRAGHGKAALRLGAIFECGVPGVGRDYAESLQWYQTARNWGETIALPGSCQRVQ